MSQILIIDDDRQAIDDFNKLFPNDTIHDVATVDEANSHLTSETTHVILLNITDNLHSENTIKTITQSAPNAIIVLISDPSHTKQAIKCLRAGAYDYLKKPFDQNDTKNTITRALERQKQNLKDPAWELIGYCDAVVDIFFMVKRVATTDSTILIQGESGAGKELIARAIHFNSNRHLNKFVSVNCGAFTPTLLESELFGHMKGSFTGADRNKQGLVEVAQGGTFFLDEISEMPLDLQVKLLRLLEEKEFIPVGANKAKKVDVRFVCATNRKLQEEVKAGTFREDLFYRLNVIPIHLPPLKDRENDVIEIAHFFINHYGQKMNSSIKKLSKEVKTLFKSYSWPGNVRELENTIQRSLALANPGQEEITLNDLEDRIKQNSTQTTSETIIDNAHQSKNLFIPEEGFDLAAHLEELEKKYIIKALEISQGNKTKAAQLLGMKFRSISYKIDKYNILN